MTTMIIGLLCATIYMQSGDLKISVEVIFFLTGWYFGNVKYIGWYINNTI